MPPGAPLVAQTAFGHQKWAPSAPKVLPMIENWTKHDTKEPPDCEKELQKSSLSRAWPGGLLEALNNWPSHGHKGTNKCKNMHKTRKNTQQMTNAVFNNGFSPIWNFEDSFHFDVKNSSVAVMQFTVWNKNSLSDDEIIASSSVPISCMRQGIRSVQLFDDNMTRSGAFDFASLLVLVKKEDSQVEI